MNEWDSHRVQVFQAVHLVRGDLAHPGKQQQQQSQPSPAGGTVNQSLEQQEASNHLSRISSFSRDSLTSGWTLRGSKRTVRTTVDHETRVMEIEKRSLTCAPGEPGCPRGPASPWGKKSPFTLWTSHLSVMILRTSPECYPRSGHHCRHAGLLVQA